MGKQGETQVRDWELEDSFYQQEKAREVRLEDYLEEEVRTEGVRPEGDEDLEKIIGDVRAVMKLAGENKTVKEIADSTKLETQYIYNILISAQGFHEDDEIAVAHLVRMG